VDPLTDAPSEPTRKRKKSPGRVLAMQRLNEAGLRGNGGRRPVHGIRALEALLARGERPEGMIGHLLAAHEQEALEDRENPTSRARGVARRSAEYELYIGLVKARLITESGALRRMSWQREKDLIMTGAALAEKYLKVAELLGIDAQVKDVLDPFRAEMLRQEREAEREERQAAEAQEGGNGTDHAEA
jgi:hypothetical protein